MKMFLIKYGGGSEIRTVKGYFLGLTELVRSQFEDNIDSFTCVCILCSQRNVPIRIDFNDVISMTELGVVND